MVIADRVAPILHAAMQTSEALTRTWGSTPGINSERGHIYNGQRKNKQQEQQQSTTKQDGKTVHDPRTTAMAIHNIKAAIAYNWILWCSLYHT